MPPVRMKPFGLRWLTAAEKALAHSVFGSAIRPDRVRVFAQPLPAPFDRSFTPGSAVLVYAASKSLSDFTHGDIRDRATFVHEMAHVWQAQHGVLLPLAKIRAGDGPKAYAYDLDAQPFHRMNIEQQASVIEDHYVLQQQDRLLGESGPPRFALARYEALRGYWFMP